MEATFTQATILGVLSIAFVYATLIVVIELDRPAPLKAAASGMAAVIVLYTLWPAMVRYKTLFTKPEEDAEAGDNDWLTQVTRHADVLAMTIRSPDSMDHQLRRHYAGLLAEVYDALVDDGSYREAETLAFAISEIEWMYDEFDMLNMRTQRHKKASHRRWGGA